MTEILLIIACALSAAGLVVAIIALTKINSSSKPNLTLDEFLRNYKMFEAEIKALTSNGTNSVLGAVDYATKLDSERISTLERRTNDLIKSVEAMNSVVEQRINDLRNVVEANLKYMSSENKQQLEQMRSVVDEKLSATLETRLNQSFELINKSLGAVNQGLGDVQNLAKDVGSLKNVLQNVKVRGTWAEVQLDNLLSEMLTADQYFKFVKVNPLSDEMVDFAVKLPGNDDTVLLPIDSKFPIEDYQRLITASQEGNKDSINAAVKNLEIRVKDEAKSISAKYIFPPRTTDFAIMYLPLEGLYAEVLRIDGLFERLQRDYRVTVCGPSTICALLNSLQVGFKSVAIEKKSAEIYNMLIVFKTQFGKFTELLDKTQKKISEAATVVEDASKRTRIINKKLKDVNSIGTSNGAELLLSEFDEVDDK